MSEYKLIINFKTYKEAFNEKSVVISQIVKELKAYALENNVEIIVVPQILDIKEQINLGVKTYSQHIDNADFGAYTGKIVPKALAKLGIKGSLISHSEDTDSIESIQKKITILNELSLESCVCAKDNFNVNEIAKLKPSFIAVEPPELIGGDISVSKAQPELILESVKSSNGIPLLVGAGIKNSEDVKIALKLGAKGVLIASGVIKSQNIKEKLLDLIKGFKKFKD